MVPRIVATAVSGKRESSLNGAVLSSAYAEYA